VQTSVIQTQIYIQAPTQGDVEKLLAPFTDEAERWNRDIERINATSERAEAAPLPPSRREVARMRWAAFWNHKLVIGVVPAIVTYVLGVLTPR